MNKVFQINLAGVIFSIDEHAYEKLSEYTNKLKQHFSDQPEVVTDIQNRMAELFLQKAGQGNIIYINHVDEVISILGNTEDIAGNEVNDEPKTNQPPQRLKKLRRNPFDESLGGVCSGIAAFFGVDTVIIRILFVASVIIYGTGILFYLILWAVLPKAEGEEAELMKLQKEQQTKKLFRDPDNRILGGVSSGIAGYFGFDIIWVRLFFIASLFLFGTGFWLYILLWVIVPKAVSATDKLIMKGISPSLKNLQQHIAENTTQNLSAKSINKTSKLVSVAFKLLIGFIAFFIFLAIVTFSVATIAFYFGVGNIEWLNHLINITLSDASVLWSGKIGLLITILIPLIGLLFLLLRLVFHFKTNFKIWLLALTTFFIFGMGLLFYAAISFGSSISYKNSKNKITQITPSDTLVIYGIETKKVSGEVSINTNEGEITVYNKGIIVENNKVFIEINEFKITQLAYGKEPLLKVKYMAKGKNADDAMVHIKQILYEPTIDGKNIYIPQFLSLTNDAQFRWQEISVDLQVPEGTIIVIDESARNVLDDNNIDEADGSIYEMRNGMLTCKNCVEPIEQTEPKSKTNDEIKIDAGPIKIEVSDGKEEKISIKIDDQEPVKKTEKVIIKDGEKTTIEETKAGPIIIKKKKTVKEE
ncbi:MAG: PspC domain-containing protein [Bacteroidia bacterium]